MTKLQGLALWWVSVLVAVAAGCGRQQPNSEAEAAVVTANADAPTEDLFTNGAVWKIEIEIPKAGLSVLRRTRWGAGNERPTVKATVKEGGFVYYDVALHLKGAAGSFRPVDDRPAMTLKFDKFVAGQSFHGLHKISLNNSVQDPSFLSEKICRELFDAAGVPVPRAGHALVTLNGRDLGLYVLVEGANRQFLKRYFNNTKGNLYDGGFVRDIHQTLAVNSGENPEDHSGLTALENALAETARAKSLAPLEQALDVDRFISMIAMEVILIHWDGYALNRNNWRIFRDLDSNRMVFIPHGVDQTFGVGQRRDSSIIPRMSGRVARAVLATPEGRRRYRQRLAQLCATVFKPDEIVRRIDEVEASLRPALMRWSARAARSQEQQANGFKQRVVRRANDLERQLGTPPSLLRFGSDDGVRLTGWQASPVRSGTPTLNQRKDPQGQPCLTVSADHGASTGSWRTTVALAAGRYRFEGRARVQGVVVEPDDTRSGAGLRISKGLMPSKMAGTTGWQSVSYEFEVEDEINEIELICELKAVQGEAWFDATSLRLVRLP